MNSAAVIDQVPSEYWDTGAARHPLQRWYHHSRFRAVGAALQNLPRGSAILDVASGSGYAIARVVRKRPDLSVTGIDISAKHVAYANRVRPHYAFIEAAAESLPFPDGRFAAVTCLDTIEHVVDVAQVLREAYRVLQPGGHIVVQLVFEEHPVFRHIWQWWVAGHGNVWKHAHLRSFTPQRLCRAVTDAGFQVGSVRLMHIGMSGIVVGKKPHG